MFSPLYYTLEQEAHVVRAAIGSGLTHLRRANLHEKGAFYTAFFQLAIGFERMAKLGIVLDHLAHNSLVPPGPQVMRALGHDIVALHTKLRALTAHRAYSLTASFAFSPFGKRVLDFLSRFARGMRYANLDALSSGSSLPTPFTEWEPILHDIVASKVRKSVINGVIAQFSAIGTAVEDGALVISSDLAGRPLDFAAAFSIPRIYDLAAPHVIWEILLLLAPMRDFVVGAGDLAARVPRTPGSLHGVPCMSEFFEFIWLDRSWQMRRKRWPD